MVRSGTRTGGLVELFFPGKKNPAAAVARNSRLSKVKAT
jgi:hypothetical protein